MVPIVSNHHENWDGSGYPEGVRGEDIPLGARILSVVDCFDALTSDRPYRAAMSAQAAFDILLARRGTMYDRESSIGSSHCSRRCRRCMNCRSSTTRRH